MVKVSIGSLHTLTRTLRFRTVSNGKEFKVKTEVSIEYCVV